MNFNIIGQLKNHKALLVDAAFYVMWSLLVALVLCYIIFSYKISGASQHIIELDKKLLVYASDEQKASEKEVFDYKKKIDDFAVIIDSHRISSNIFSFIEEKTLPNVWFNIFNFSEGKKEISLSGEAENMEALSNQIKAFEASKNYVKSINVLTSQATAEGKARFTLNLSLNSAIFEDKTSVSE